MKKPIIIILSIIGVILLIAIGTFVYFKVAYISKDEVREIVYRDTRLNSNDIHFTNIDLDTEENLYEVEFYIYNQDADYEYKINAKNGRIIYNNFKLSTNNSSSTQTPNQNNTNSNNQSNSNTQNNTSNNTNVAPSANDISIDEAKQIALKDAGINQDQNNITFTELKTDYDHGIKIYEIEFIYNYREYNYEINASNGQIISYESDHR